MFPALKLNLGCGGDWMGNGVLNLDRDHLRAPEGMRYYRADAEDLAHYIETASADEIWAKNLLEEIPAARRIAALRLWLSLLTPGGKLFLKSDLSEGSDMSDPADLSDLCALAGGRIAGRKDGLLIVVSDASNMSDLSDGSDPSDLCLHPQAKGGPSDA